MNLYELTIKQAANGLREKQFSSVELTQCYLDRIKKINPEIFAYLSVDEEGSLIQAEGADKKLASSESGLPLLGIPFAIKDNMLIQGGITTAASKILENYKAPYTATAVRKLKEAGAIVLGKTNLDEFAMGSSTENSAFGVTKNPWDRKRVPGGSSGGSAAAVAADLAAAALGSDTGGSIRQPAGYCGVVGMKPTYGRVSRHGLIAMASSLDQIGPFGKSVYDTGLVLQAISGFDKKDSTTVRRDKDNYLQDIDSGIKGLRVGVPQEYFVEGMDRQVWETINQSIEKLRELGAEIKEVSLPSLKYALSTYYIIMPVEVASNLARFDGIRYGLSHQDQAELLEEVYKKSKSAGFGDEAKRRIMLGTYASSAGYYDAYYKKALKVQQALRIGFKEIFDEVDVLAGPTSPSVPFEIGSKSGDPLQMYLEDVLTVPANIAGLPGITVPAGLVNNLPVGLQLQGRWWEEAKLLRVAFAFEQAVGFRDKHRPAI